LRRNAFRQYVQETASTDGARRAAEIARLAQLRDQGVLSESEFEQAKALA
jgi:Short C-terminal domain